VAALRLAAAAAVLAFAWTGPAAAATPLPATTLAPNPALFGDRITATVTVVVDKSAAPGVRAVAGFGSLDVLGGPVQSRSDRGERTELQFGWTIACLNENCVPGGRTRQIALPPVRLTGSVSATARWPVLTIASRVSAADAAAASPPFRLETQLPPPTYRVSPRWFALALDVVAVLLVVAAVLVVVRELRRRRRRQEEDRLAALSLLEWALIYAREAEQRGPVERRKALDLLARALGGRAERLAGTAEALAWSPRKPSPEQVASLVGDVEREVGER
jgi:hypothetical protein